MKAAAGAGYATATDLADWLVRTLGLPFREAHHVTGRIVAPAAEGRQVALEALPLDDMQAVEPPHRRPRVLGARRRGSGREPHELRRHGARQCAARRRRAGSPRSAAGDEKG